jgi:hypothetical protein
MALDVRSLREWVQDIFGRGRLSGGGALGAPSLELEEAAPGPAQETDRADSGDRLESNDPPGKHRADRSRI